MSRPSVFIGSSSEGYDVARAIEAILKDALKEVDVTLWKNGVFGLGQGTLESLVKAIHKFDFAILVLTPDDVTESRDIRTNSPRDNVLFEAGLFMGRLGRERVFIIYPRNKDMKLPSDFAGVTVATYEEVGNTDLRSAISAASYDMIDTIRRLGKIGKIILMQNHPLLGTIDGLLRNINAALRINHAYFLEEMAFHCREWLSMSKDWSQGKVVVRQNYEKLLANVYHSATTSIFSTSIPQYQKTWLSPMGKSLVRIQERNKSARSTRVFIFDTDEDVTSEDNELFEEHARAGIEVLIYLDREDPTFLFPADVGTDWTIIDEGNAIGVTRQMGDVYEAQWYFNDESQAERFRDFEQRLRRGSMTLQQWKERLSKGT
jgi:hypothetical protein